MLFNNSRPNRVNKKSFLFSPRDEMEDQVNLEAPGDLDMNPPAMKRQNMFSLTEGESDGMPVAEMGAEPAVESATDKYSYGLTDPGLGKKPSKFQTILSLFNGGMSGLANDEGLFNGITKAANAEEGLRGERSKQELDKYYKDRDFRQKTEDINARNAMSQAELDALSGYRDRNLGINAANAKTNRIKATKPQGEGRQSDLETYASAMEQIKSAAANGLPVPTRAKAIVDAYRSKNYLD